MPKETFFNLGEEKRNFIESCALDEFVTYGFDKGSINRIIERCGIAKGSFYQYFANKKDLFIYLVNQGAIKKLNYMSPILLNPEEHDFFTLLREMYLSGLRFAHNNPKHVAIGNQVLKNKDHPIYEEALGSGTKKAYTVFEDLLKKAVEKGELRPDVDIGFISYMISNMNVSTIEYYYEKVCLGETNIEQWDENIMGTVDLLIDFVKKGIGQLDE